MNIIYGICSWGLGHATRSLPLIRRLIDEDNSITIVSYGRSLELLKKELNGNAEYVEIIDYPILLSENTRQFLAKSLIHWPLFIKRIESGLIQLTKILKKKKYNLLISDGRYDIYSKKIRSFFISHQIRIMNPLRIKMLESGSELFNLFFFRRYCGIIVPDYIEDNLSGELSHNLKRIDEEKLHYVGALSDFKKKTTKRDIDCLISLSGPEPQRSILEQKLLYQINDTDSKIIITLGKTEQTSLIKNNNVTIYSFLTKEKREEFLNRAKMIISRSGYSTIMDIAVIGLKALMIPTPGQIEQEYLAKYHSKKGTFFSVKQENINFEMDCKYAKKKSGIRRLCNVDKTVENIMDVLSNVQESPF